jgi:carbamoyltransferase
MLILGIHDGYNSCAALTENGRVLAVVQEERMTGIKNQAGFPIRSIDEVLRLAGRTRDQIDFVAMNGNHIGVPVNRDELLKKFREFSSPVGTLKRIARNTPINDWYRERCATTRREHLRGVGFDLARVRYVEHHLAHASAAYFGSPWRDGQVLVLTCDGAGDDLSATVNVGEGGTLKRLAEIPDSDSLGLVYGMVTFLLGMTPNDHEYKLMGLAPYAPARGSEPVYRALREYLKISKRNPLVWERTRGYPHSFYSYPFLRRAFELQRFDCICGGLQRFTEDLLAEWVANCVRETGLRRIALGGGVGMNVKANKRIVDLPEVDSLFVFPSCTDESNAIGAAWWVYATERRARHEPVDIPPLSDIYWGPSYSDEACEEAVAGVRDGVRVRQVEDVELEIARMLAGGEVVARFSGRMEFGARALGNRSILADPSNWGVVRIINEMVKSRDFWMPFAPSVLDSAGPRYVRNQKGLAYPYMILAFDSNGNSEGFQAALHPYDRTIRPQEVYAAWNPSYHRLIAEFERLTGRAIILNTSLNLHGHPLVCSPEQALQVFLNSGLPHLALGHSLLSK